MAAVGEYFGDELAGGVGVGDVGLVAVQARGVCTGRGLKAGEFFLTTPGNDDGGRLVEKRQGDGSAERAGATSDERYFVFESSGHRVRSRDTVGQQRGIYDEIKRSRSWTSQAKCG
ncbi:MAG: hypothetical protein WBP95_19605, partial [Acidobacteriaceae bacterium]